MTAVNLELKK